ncbi:MAG TPA: hypothetical protein PLN27_12810 [Acidobacteriota bacterium]|nr:hypothetical protein [Acidobacteriota bacterium]
MRRLASGVLWICFAMGVIGAVAQDAVQPPASAPESAEARVKARVESFWTAKKERKLDICYDMLTRASRETMTMVDYIRRNNTRILGYTVDTIQIDPQDPTRAHVEVRCDIHAMGRKMSNLLSRQQWLLEEDVWRCVHASRSPFDRSAEQAAEAAAAPRSDSTDAELQKQREAINRIRQKYGQSPSLPEAVSGSPEAVVPAAGQPVETAKTDSAAAPGQQAADGKTKPAAEDKTKAAAGAAADKAKPAPATKSETSADKQKKDPPPGI